MSWLRSIRPRVYQFCLVSNLSLLSNAVRSRNIKFYDKDIQSKISEASCFTFSNKLRFSSKFVHLIFSLLNLRIKVNLTLNGNKTIPKLQTYSSNSLKAAICSLIFLNSSSFLNLKSNLYSYIILWLDHFRVKYTFLALNSTLFVLGPAACARSLFLSESYQSIAELERALFWVTRNRLLLAYKYKIIDI